MILPATRDQLRPLPQRGFSLVEIMIALVLGLLLIVGLMSIFVSKKRSADLNTVMANMQESSRFALSAMTDDIRMAGYQGCLDLAGGAVDIIADNPPSANLQRTAISGAVVQANDAWVPAPELGAGTQAFDEPDSVAPRRGTHTLAVQFGLNPASALTGPQVVGSTPNPLGSLPLATAIDVQVGDLALVSTCETGELFRVTSASVDADGSMQLGHGNGSNSRNRFQQIYGLPETIGQTRVMPFATQVYFVADTGERNISNDPVHALYQQSMPFNDPTNPPVLLVEGVENLQVRFGIGAPEGQLRYVTATDAAYDPTRIRSVRIGMLMASRDPVADIDEGIVYRLAGAAVSSAATADNAAQYMRDKRFRLAFNTTVTVRNRRSVN